MPGCGFLEARRNARRSKDWISPPKKTYDRNVLTVMRNELSLKMLDFILHVAYTLLQHFAKDQTQRRTLNKDMMFTAFESTRSCSGLQCRKNSYSRFLRPTKLKDRRNLLQNLYFLSGQLESRFKNVNREILTAKGRQL